MRISTRPLIGNHLVNYDHNNPMHPHLQMRMEAGRGETCPVCYKAPLLHITSVREYMEFNVNL